VLAHSAAAVDASEFDVAVVVIGERPYAEGMGDLRDAGEVARGSGIVQDRADLAPYGQSLDLSTLHPEDLEAIRSASRAGIPVVTVMVSGRPLVVDAELELSAAFVAAWLPGSEGGGVADVLFGDHDFSGRLAFSWPAAGIALRDGSPLDHEPRFPCGHGLKVSHE
jgi:beta-glucosidase